MARAELSTEFVEESASEGATSDSELESINGILHDIPGKAKQKQKRSSSEESDSDEDSTSDGSSASDDLDVEANPRNSISNGVKRKADAQPDTVSSKKTRKSAPSHIPSRSYLPPAGYLPLKATPSNPMLSKSNLDSKQIWHITAPATVPLTKIKSLDIQAALRGEQILEHRGIKYNMQTMPTALENLLIPSENPVSTGNGTETTVSYEPMQNTFVTRSFCLREMTSSNKGQPREATTQNSAPSTPSGRNLNDADGATSPSSSNSDGTGISFFAKSTGSQRAPRRQPKGLLKRFHPIGSNDSGKETMPDPLGNEPNDISGPDSDNETNKKDNKTRKTPEKSKTQVNGFIAVPDPDDSDDDDKQAKHVPETPQRSSSSSRKHSKEKSQKTPKKKDNGDENDDSSDHDDVEQEKQRRREERKKKKEKKQKIPAGSSQGGDDDGVVDRMDIDQDSPVVVNSSPAKKEKRKEKHRKKEKISVVA